MDQTKHSHLAAPQVPRAILQRFAALALACSLLPLAGCPRNHAFADAESLAVADTPLAWTVLGAHATRHLATSSMEARDAAPGNQFVVLDVSVRNRNPDPQVLSEGKLIALDESSLQTFDTPVNVLNDDYLSLQVLAPDQSMRGKIAYEVPEHLPGVLYWSPGNGSKRILLDLATAPAAQRTLGNAEDAATGTAIPREATDTGIAPTPSTDPVDTAAARGTTTHVEPPQPRHVVAQAAVPQTRVAPAGAPRHAPLPVPPVARAPMLRPAEVPPLQPALEVASIDTPSSIVRLPTQPRVATAAPGIDASQSRRAQCERLVARDDPADKARNLDFFAQSCREYTLPSRWQQPVAHRSLLSRASELLARVVVRPQAVRVPVDTACRGSHAAMLVCSDPGLAAMDRQLAQSIAQAQAQGGDASALQRDQQQWRGQVRDSCDSVRCLELAYGRRLAQVESLAALQP